MVRLFLFKQYLDAIQGAQRTAAAKVFCTKNSSEPNLPLYLRGIIIKRLW